MSVLWSLSTISTVDEHPKLRLLFGYSLTRHLRVSSVYHNVLREEGEVREAGLKNPAQRRLLIELVYVLSVECTR